MENVFKNRNFALTFFGGLVSNVGAALYSFAVGFFILEITGNNAVTQNNYLALCTAGMLIATLPGGVISDKYNRAKVMYICDYLKGALVLITTFLIIRFAGSSQLQVTVLFVFGFIGNIVSGIFYPASDALMPMIVKEEQLQQATSYTQARNGFQSIAGVLLAGILYSLLPATTLFIIVGLCYVASGVSEMFIRYDFVPKEDPLTLKYAVGDIKEGFRYAVSFKPLLALMTFSLLANFFATPIGSVPPYFVRTEVASAQSYLFDSFLTPELWSSVITTAMGVGMILMALVLSARPQKEHNGPDVKKGIVEMAAICVAFAAAYHILYIRLGRLDLLLIGMVLGFFGAGLVSGKVNVLCGASMMKVVDKDKLGKVMGITAIASQAMAPIASVIAGQLIYRHGIIAPLIFVAAGLSFMAIFGVRSKALDEL